MNSQFDRQNSTLWISILFSVLLIATIFSVGFMYYQDYPKETLYFICILSTLGITGYLSFYAWQHRDIRSALPFMLMEIGECLLALFEIFSMISSTDTQALFWFNLRFLLTATIPVAWLAFTITFGGQTHAVTKSLMAWTLAIPMITQVLLWSNPLHGLWVKHEVDFQRIGPFWLAETSARIPGEWFMVHTFYSMILVLAGTALLLQIAWKKRRTYQRQALLLSMGAVIALTTTLFPIFNLRPHSEFNPFIPGMGISAILYALAVFRFQFLKRTSTQEFTTPIPNLEPQSTRSMILLIFIFVLMATGLSTTGYISYQNYEMQFRTQVESQLTSIAALKTNELVDWYNQRLGDATVIYENRTFAELAKRALEVPADAQAQTQLQAWLESIQKNYQYDRVYLLDIHAVERFSAPNSSESITSNLLPDTEEAIHSKKIIFADFHRDSNSSPIHLAILIPLFTRAEAVSPVGIIVLRINPEKYLYPFINEWPAPSSTAETLIVRRDGNAALFLNNLKFKPDAALTLRIPLTETSVPAVRAVLGQIGIMEGVDYRGVSVLADVHPMPDLPWFLIAKIDTAEVFAPLQKRAWDIIFLFGTLIIGAAAGLAVIWRRQSLRFYQAQYETAESLRKSEERYHHLFNILDEGMAINEAVFDENGNIVDYIILSVNPAFEKQTIYKTDQVLGKKATDVYEMSTEYIREWWQSHSQIQTSTHTEMYHEPSQRWFHITTTPIEEKRFATIFIDVTENKLAEMALRESDEKYRLLVDQAPYGIAIHQGGQVVFVNQACVTLMLAENEAELLGKPIVSFIAPENRAATGARIARMLQGEVGLYPIEDRYVRMDGSAIPVEVIAAPFIFNGQPAIQIIAQDISKRKNAEEAVQLSEARYRSLVETQADIIARSDLLGNLSFVNDSFCRVFGILRDQTLGMDFRKTVFPEDLSIITEAMQAIQQPPHRKYIEMRNITTEGIRWFGWDNSAVLDEHGKIIEFQGVGHDVTERKQAEQKLRNINAELEQRVAQRTAELNQTNIELEQANRTKDEFLANMSHELRTPLNSILGLSESLLEQRRDPLSEHQQRSLKIIESSGSHLLELINDILDLSKIEAGKFDYHPQIIEVDDLCRASLTFVKEQAIRKSIMINYQPETVVSKIYADPRRLKQILVNLLTNAVKFTPNQGHVTLQIHDDVEQDRIEFSIIDTGIGIAPEDLQSLFVPFSQVDSGLTREYEGTGLGLALVQKLTDLHGGSVYVESEVGKGSRFTINLPVGQAIIAQQMFIKSSSKLPPSEQALPLPELANRGMILLAEDNIANIMTIGDYLESRGYQVAVAHDGLEAIKKAEDLQPDIILMDVQMPALDGLEATRHLRALPRFTTTPIIALTALAMPGDRERCLGAGANEYMSKPVSLKELAKTIKQLLKQPS